jgi:hypothetical protein
MLLKMEIRTIWYKKNNRTLWFTLFRNRFRIFNYIKGWLWCLLDRSEGLGVGEVLLATKSWGASRRTTVTSWQRWEQRQHWEATTTVGGAGHGGDGNQGAKRGELDWLTEARANKPKRIKKLEKNLCISDIMHGVYIFSYILILSSLSNHSF